MTFLCFRLKLVGELSMTFVACKLCSFIKPVEVLLNSAEGGDKIVFSVLTELSFAGKDGS